MASQSQNPPRRRSPPPGALPTRSPRPTGAPRHPRMRRGALDARATQPTLVKMVAGEALLSSPRKRKRAVGGLRACDRATFVVAHLQVNARVSALGFFVVGFTLDVALRAYPAPTASVPRLCAFGICREHVHHCVERVSRSGTSVLGDKNAANLATSLVQCPRWAPRALHPNIGRSCGGGGGRRRASAQLFYLAQRS